MPLVKAEQFDQEQHGVILGQTVAGAPLGDRLLEFVIEIARFHCWPGYFVGNNRSEADSISAKSFRCQV